MCIKQIIEFMNLLSNLQIAKIICRIFGKNDGESIEFVSDRPGHDFRYSLNSEKISSILGIYNPRNLETELAIICEQLKSRKKKYDSSVIAE